MHHLRTLSILFVIFGSTVLSAQITRIYDIQTNGNSTTMGGSTVLIEGIVTADYQANNELNGFFVQDTIVDGDSLSSEALFIHDNGFGVAVNVGDYVNVRGKVFEWFGSTQLRTIDSVVVLSSGNSITPIILSLPMVAGIDFEPIENMLVNFPQSLTVTEVYNLGRFGELILSGNGKQEQPTHTIDPTDSAALATLFDLNARNRILLDDGSETQNKDPVPFLDPSTNTLRAGSTVSSLLAVMHYSFSTWRLEPSVAPTFNYGIRPNNHDFVGGTVKILAWNVENFFNGDGLGGGFPASRGASSNNEFNRQKAKIKSVLDSVDAQFVALIEIENDGDSVNSAIKALADVVGYDYAEDPSGTNGPGGDEIKVALIHAMGYNVMTPPIADSAIIHNRNPIAYNIRTPLGLNEDNGVTDLTLIIVHFKSKNCGGASGLDLDQGDGQSCYNYTRVQQAIALIDFVAAIKATTDWTERILIVGDFNAYEKEDPIDTLISSGLILKTAGNYGYGFDGLYGSLDHVFVNEELDSLITGVTTWHINSDEPRVLDYNTENKPGGAYSPSPFRSSDHDPIIIGLDLFVASGITQVADDQLEINVYPVPVTNTVNFDVKHKGGEELSLQIFNVLGKLIYSRSQSADEKLQWTPSAASAVYFYRIQVGEKHASGKIVRLVN